MTNFVKSQALLILEQGIREMGAANKKSIDDFLALPVYKNMEYIVMTKSSTIAMMKKKLMRYVKEVRMVATGDAHMDKYVKDDVPIEDKRDLLNCMLKLSSDKYKKKVGARVPSTLNLEATVGIQTTLFRDVFRILALYLSSAKKRLMTNAYISHRAAILKIQYEKSGTTPALTSELQKMIQDYKKIDSEIIKLIHAKQEYSPDANLVLPAEQMAALTLEVPMELPEGMDKIPLWTEEEFSAIQNKPIIQMLRERLQYLGPLTYEQMIGEWEQACARAGCNYLAIEYPEFAKPGGYQMAINAKPLFIKKALELCGDKNVLYIDGDMTINKYPHIFDMPDVDYMARGWWMDPRSSYRMNKSILYDPYLFETSGGTMFFSQSREAKKLIDMWIQESEKPINAGKADDRIISMIFNSLRLLLNMKIVQLPIEYLWLTLDYDDRMAENVEWDKEEMKKIRDSIYIEHPECLTSEDTATGAGAASDRTPKLYKFVSGDSMMEPISEVIHESVFFQEPQYANEFKEYLKYISTATYLDDGNTMLYAKKLVDKENPENNESPVYLVPYEQQYETKKTRDYGDGQLYSELDIVQANMSAVQQVDLNALEIRNIDDNSVELRNERGVAEKEIIRGILRLLQEGKNVYYNPVHMPNYNAEYYRKIQSPIYSELEFAFSPNIVDYYFHSMFRPQINLHLPMFFKAGCKPLIQLLSMFMSFEELSNYLYNGTYEFLSRLRIGYVRLRAKPKPKPQQETVPPLPTPSDESCKKRDLFGRCVISGGEPQEVDGEEIMDDYESALEFFYGNSPNNSPIGGNNKGKRKSRKALKKRKQRGLSRKMRKSRKI